MIWFFLTTAGVDRHELGIIMPSIKNNTSISSNAESLKIAEWQILAETKQPKAKEVLFHCLIQQ